MKFANTIIFTSSLLLLMSAPSLAARNSNFYAGASLGYGELSGGCNSLSAAATFTGECDASDFSYKFFGGYNFSKNYGVEVFYASLPDFYANGVQGGASLRAEGDLDAWGVAGTVSQPITRTISVTGKLGLIYSQYDGEQDNAGTKTSIDESKFDLMLGLGAQVQITRDLTGRVEWERFRAADASGSAGDVDVFSGGVSYGF